MHKLPGDNISNVKNLCIEIQEVNFGGRVLRSRNVLRFRPFYDPDIHMMVITSPELKIFVSGKTWEELRRGIEEEIVFLWEEYALEKEENMTKGAIDLKKKLLETFEEIMRSPEHSL